MVLHYGDMTDATNLIRLLQETQPDEIYNRAAQSHVQVSFETPEYTAMPARHTAAAGSDPKSSPRGQDPILPGLHIRTIRCPGYAAEGDYPVLSTLAIRGAKLYAYWITVNYRPSRRSNASTIFWIVAATAWLACGSKLMNELFRPMSFVTGLSFVDGRHGDGTPPSHARPPQRDGFVRARSHQAPVAGREFMDVDDLADALVFLMERYDEAGRSMLATVWRARRI